ncbi:MAG: ABC transporter ATP-binding protein [Clostridiales Family XIII bacterium]|jgi:oligopeptide/dipeptide ABC transporter ATP-binding protein|nr:ABC transporter ATP-binding protein [Clostridiales Family XIII bacterium]
MSVATESNEKILDVKNLKMYFPVTRGVLRRKVAEIKAVDDVSLSLRPGETLGLVGESGCGKTTVGRCILRLYEPTAGEIVFEGEDITRLNARTLRAWRRKMSLVFQDPYSSLDPRMNSGDIVGEPLLIHGLVSKGAAYRKEVEKLFGMAGLDPRMMDRFPHEYSGGQRQRLSIARSLAGDPSLIICDEPISALDVSMQAQILNLLHELRDKKPRLSYIFISHDLPAVQYISHRVAVMYLGRIMEIADSTELYSHTLHPYSIALLSAIPIPDPDFEAERKRIVLEGDVPTPLNPPKGCSFHPRCWRAQARCGEETPELKEVSPSHRVACHFV